MTREVFDQYLNDRYHAQVKWMEKKAANYKKRYTFYQWMLIILSAVTPILAALEGKQFIWRGQIYTLDIQMIVVVVSAVVAILTTGLKTFSYHELWINYRQTVELLKPELQYYYAALGRYGQNGVDREAIFVDRVERILAKEHTNWPSTRNPGEENETKK